MTAKIISGTELSQSIKSQLQNRINLLKAQGVTPCLTVILVGDDPASKVYVNNKHNTFNKMNLASSIEHYPADMTQEALCQRIKELNANPLVHGILVQLPLPKHLDTQKIIAKIAPQKDVDGFHIENAGALMIGKPRVIPCTPYGIMKMLEVSKVPIRSANAVIVGASNIVGKPIALLLQAAGATVTICNSKTRNLASHTKQADILVVAVGQPEIIKGDMIKPGAVVIDVGINRRNDHSLCGDVDFKEAKEVAGFITPVPGGVGPMTITMLLVNTIEATERSLKQ